MIDERLLREEVEEVRAGGVLGRSHKLRRLFDYLAACSLADRSPKEAEIATEVFGRDAGFDGGQDAVVRVYVHKLRRRLEEIYAGPRRDADTRLTIPLGDYRLAPELRRDPLPGAAASPPPIAPGQRWRPMLVAAAALSLIVLTSMATLVIREALLPAAVKDNEILRAGPVWGPVARNGFPTLVVLGDYYIFGDSDNGMEVSRLVREYPVNSRADLDEFVARHPDKVGHYIDLDLRYLPIGSAAALRDVVPMIEPDGRQTEARVLLASELTTNMLKSNNIIYIGYLSGLGVLRDAEFSGSRFSVGSDYDEVIDGKTGRHFVSQGGGPDSNGAVYRDYGLLSTFDGPAGNRFVIIAGTRDVALMQTAEAATRLISLREAIRRAGGGAFEALYQVDGMNRSNVGGRLIAAGPRDGSQIWSGGSSAKTVYPAG